MNTHHQRLISAFRNWLLTALSALIFAACGGTTATTQSATVAVGRGDLSQTISGSGQVEVEREGFLNFATSGTVAEIAVEAGQTVQAGDLLATLDTTDLQQSVVEAEATLASAKASLADLQDGASATDLRKAEATLKSAQVNLAKANKGNARPSAIASARAQLKSAEASLAALKQPGTSDREAAEIKVTSAQTSLESTRNSASANKTKAGQSLDQATQTLTQAQVAYATAKKNWEYIQETGNDPTNPSTTNSAGKKVANKLSETQRQQYYDTYAQSEASLRNAESGVQSAQVSYDNARQQEVTDVQNAEQSLADAKRQLTALTNPSAKDLASAESSVAQARASLAELSGGTQNDIADAEQSVVQAQAELDALKAPPTEAELAEKQASVSQAEAGLADAQRNLAKAQLTAPFDGTVAAVNISVGETSGGDNATNNTASDTAAIYVIDASAYVVDVNISEVDLAQLNVGQSAQVTIDALSSQVLTGTVALVSLVPTVDQNVTTYATRVRLDPTSQPLRVGLSAAVTITTAERSNVLLVPNIAITEAAGSKQVSVRKGEQNVATTITTGLAGQSYTEVLSGLQEGDQVVLATTSTSSLEQSQGGSLLPGGNGGGPGNGGMPSGGAPSGNGGAPSGRP